jgi:hypothetical protein
MSLLIAPPTTVRVTAAGLTEILPALPNNRYKIFALQLVSANRTREISLFEGINKRWQGEIQSNTNIRIDIGNTGWDLSINTPLLINTSGSLTLDVNVLQYGILL